MTSARTADHEFHFIDRSVTFSGGDGVSVAPLQSVSGKVAVLLGGPGSGKSTALEQLCSARTGVFFHARQIKTYLSRCFNSDVFIDGLDEVGPNKGFASLSIDEVLCIVSSCEANSVTLACRDVDWFNSSVANYFSDLNVYTLNELSEGDICEYLVKNKKYSKRDVDEVRQLIRTEPALLSFVSNPLLLDLFAISRLTNRENPEYSMKALLEDSCRHMASENNRAHQHAIRSRNLSVDKIIDVAGSISAALLITGLDSIDLNPGSDIGNEFWDSFMNSQYTHQDGMIALESKLFVCNGGVFAPRHRYIAEYLAGKYIAKRLDSGTPASRALNLVQGYDGRIVDGLIGLFAWICTFAIDSFPWMLNVDPLAFVLHGDPSGLPLGKKLKLIELITDNGARVHLNGLSRNLYRKLGSLGGADMQDGLVKLLGRDSSSDGIKRLALYAIKFGSKSDCFIPHVASIILDEQASTMTREVAIEVLCDLSPDRYTVKRIFNGLNGNSVLDMGHDLSGLMLHLFYPSSLSTKDILERPFAFDESSPMNWSHAFWRGEFEKRVPSEDVCFAAHIFCADRNFPSHFYDDMNFHDYQSWVASNRSRLVLRALTESREEVSDQALLNWVRACQRPLGRSFVPAMTAEFGALVNWFNSNPGRLVAIYVEYLRGMNGDVLSMSNISPFGRFTFPTDFPISLCKIAENECRSTAKLMFSHASARALKSENHAAYEFILDWRRSCPWFPWSFRWARQYFVSKLNCMERSDFLDGKRSSDRALLQSKLNDAIATQIANESLLPSASDSFTRLLSHEFERSNVKTIGPERFYELVGGNELAASSAFSHLKNYALKADAPSLDFDVERLDSFVITTSAGLLEVFYPDFLVDLPHRNKACLMSAVVLDSSINCAWVDRLIDSCPRLFADYLLKGCLLLAKQDQYFCVGGMRTQSSKLCKELMDVDYFVKLLDLIQEKEVCEQMSNELNFSVLPFVRKFSCANDFVTILKIQLDRSRPDIIRVPIIFQLSIFDSSYLDLLIDLELTPTVKAMIARCFLRDHKSIKDSAVSKSVSVLSRVSGEIAESSIDSCEDAVRKLLERLSSIPSAEASESLSAFRLDRSMSKYDVLIDYCIEFQASLRRKAMHTKSFEDVRNVLSNEKPIDRRDLALLIQEQSIELCKFVHSDDANSIDLFYKVGKRGLVTAPKIENQCRDVLLTLLKTRLASKGIFLTSEHRQPGEKRSDLQAIFGVGEASFHIPVELKKSSDKDMWTAWDTQLMQGYCRSKESDGWGVFLVLWFGKATSCPDHGFSSTTSGARAAEILSDQITLAHSRVVGAVLNLDRTFSRKK